MRINELASWPALDIFYARLDACKILEDARTQAIRRRRNRIADEAASASVHAAVARCTEVVDGVRRFKDDLPTLFHSTETDRAGFDLAEIFVRYPATLRPDVQALFKRYKLIDQAIKVVGVGSVGTRCGIGLFAASDSDMLILQVKEARASVLSRTSARRSTRTTPNVLYAASDSCRRPAMCFSGGRRPDGATSTCASSRT